MGILEKNTEMRNYFLFHYLFYFAIHLDEKSRAIAHDMLTMYSEENHILQSMLLMIIIVRRGSGLKGFHSCKNLLTNFLNKRLRKNILYAHYVTIE